MKTGVCVQIENAEIAAGAGYCVLEPALSKIAELDSAALAEYSRALAAAGMSLTAVNNFFPPRLRLSDSGTDFAAVRDYLRDALSKAEWLGCKTAVLGSGGARRTGGEDMGECLKRFERVVEICGVEGQSRGITICVEELNSAETDMITTYGEAVKLAERIAMKNVAATADIFHMAAAGEDIFAQLAAHIPGHVHICNPFTRLAPTAADGFDYAALGALLRKIGYRGGVSIEARFSRLGEELAAALPVAEIFG